MMKQGTKEQQDSMRVDDDVIGKLTFEEALKLLSEGRKGYPEHEAWNGYDIS